MRVLERDVLRETKRSKHNVTLDKPFQGLSSGFTKRSTHARSRVRKMAANKANSIESGKIIPEAKYFYNQIISQIIEIILNLTKAKQIQSKLCKTNPTKHQFSDAF
jgi:hypothetical protein